ncbi:MAG: hypothetical protein AW09_003455 [Candidatus Accumulibacter phosphatis]|uniref:Uncharacterized protein n=1 Tax=Candidatus Accumulibacter phosphatis TaxID=327160 RepID=A0A080LSL1_9PROT|nr:MAG: hypothetical protein AW09_003455 [Candidatus Accumulibacter phosphatis]
MCYRVAVASQSGTPPQRAGIGVSQPESREQLVQVQTFRGGVYMYRDRQVASVHFDARHQISASDAEIQRCELQHTVVYSEMRIHLVEQHVLGQDLLATEMHIRVGRVQLFQTERLGRQHLVAEWRGPARLRTALSSDEAAEVSHQQLF